MSIKDKIRGKKDANLQFSFDVGPSSFRFIKKRFIKSLRICGFSSSIVLRLLHQSLQSPIASGNFVNLKSKKISTCELRRKVKLNKDRMDAFSGCMLGWPFPVVSACSPNRLIEAAKTTVLFNNKADIFGFALIPR